jgi:DNA-binding transcriptional regulator YdaS (Cro superfamily)
LTLEIHLWYKPIMQPKDYLIRYSIKQKDAAQAIGLEQSAFNHKLHHKRRWTPEEAKAWETYTKGMVSRVDVLWPDE